MWRPRRLSYEYANGKLTEHFGFVSFFGLLVEDWLTEPWKLAKEATVVGRSLRVTHAALSAKVSKATDPNVPELVRFSHELFPTGKNDERRVVVYCAIDSDKPCPDWPNPVEFGLERRGGLWKVGKVRER